MSDEQEPKPVDPIAAQADRLEKALADLDARKRAAAELEAKNAPHRERLRALEAQVAALPQSERRVVLDAMGRHSVSAAPTPIEPVSQSGFIGAQPPRYQPPRWPLWQSVPKVELWQAVLLTLGIEPTEALKTEARDPEPKSHLQRGRLPHDFFERRRACFLALSTEGPIRPQGPLYSGMLRDARCPVLLAEVAAFLARAGFIVPSEANATEDASAQTGPGGADDGNTWLDGVRDYVVTVQQQERCKSAKEFFAALERLTSEEGSPFEKGTGADRGKLVIRATRAAVAEKTLSNRWKEIREAAA